jgi:hypothetical protein
MLCNAYAPSYAQPSGLQAHGARDVEGSPQLEARRREIMQLLEEIRAPQSASVAEIAPDTTR